MLVVQPCYSSGCSASNLGSSKSLYCSLLVAMAEEDRETPHSHHFSCRMNQNEIVRYTSPSKRQATSLPLAVVPSRTEQAQRERAAIFAWLCERVPPLSVAAWKLCLSALTLVCRWLLPSRFFIAIPSRGDGKRAGDCFECTAYQHVRLVRHFDRKAKKTVCQ